MSAGLLRHGFDIRISTLGLSMFPLIASGDRIVITPQGEINIGDVIVFVRADAMVCHRLAHVFERDGIEYYVTRGDNCTDLDESVTSDQIVGKVIRIEREQVSLARRILLFAYPVLRFGRLNALVISGLTKAGNILGYLKLAPGKSGG